MKTIKVATTLVASILALALAVETRAGSHATKEQTLEFIGNEVGKCRRTESDEDDSLVRTARLENETLIVEGDGEGKTYKDWTRYEILLEDIGEMEVWDHSVGNEYVILRCKDKRECAHFEDSQGSRESDTAVIIKGCSVSGLTSIVKAIKHLQKLYDKQEKLF